MKEQQINWYQQLEEDAKNIVDEAKEWAKDNPDVDLLEKFEEDEDDEPFYLHEFIDDSGYFIYLDKESLKEYIDLLFQFEEYEEDIDLCNSNGDYRQSIAELAFYTYKNALRDKIKEKLEELQRIEELKEEE